MSKKIILIAIFILLIGCSNQNNQLNDYHNIIKVRVLNEDEQSIVSILKNNSMDFEIFDFEVGKDYKSFDVWVDKYKNGELISTQGMLKSSLYNTTGSIALIIQDDNWILTNESNGSTSSISFGMNEDFFEGKTVSKATVSLRNQIEITENFNIVLQAQLFQEGNSTSTYNPQEYVLDSDLLNEYDFAYVIKCKFKK